MTGECANLGLFLSPSWLNCNCHNGGQHVNMLTNNEKIHNCILGVGRYIGGYVSKKPLGFKISPKTSLVLSSYLKHIALLYAYTM